MILNSCPACASTNISIMGMHSNTKSVFCAHCGTRTDQWLTQEEAVKAWNSGKVVPLPGKRMQEYFAGT